MKIAFLSNVLTPHQKPFSDQIYKTIKYYYFIEFSLLTQERIKLGWKEQKAPYLIKYYLNERNKKIVNEIIEDYDVIIYGSAPDKILKKRIKRNKLTLKYAERFYREKITWKNFFRAIVGFYLHYGRFKKNKFYILCSSAYTARDVNTFCNYKDKTYKWGYFPELKKYSNITKIIKEKKRKSILWVGRLVELKHPEMAIEVAKKLKEEKFEFELIMIGDGDLKTKIEKLISLYDLKENVALLGNLKEDKVRFYMEKSQIFLFTSDRREGWGVVLNEAMNSACAVIGGHLIGSVPFLIKNNINGLIFQDKNIKSLYDKVKYLLLNDEVREKISENAYYTIIKEWSPEIAAKRLQILTEELIKNDSCDLFESGPCSKAEILQENWFIE